jgi:hypothetical protein
MKANYELFGSAQVIAYDLTFHLFREKHDSGKDFKLGAIVGLSNTRRIVPFALVITVDETK